MSRPQDAGESEDCRTDEARNSVKRGLLTDRNQEATCYVGNLDERASDAIVWELMLQAGPIVKVHSECAHTRTGIIENLNLYAQLSLSFLEVPKDRITSTHQGYGFAEFQTEVDAEYACKILNGIKLFGKPLRINKASSDRKQVDIGANLFVGNLDSAVDERILFETFSAFGNVVGLPKVSPKRVKGAYIVDSLNLPMLHFSGGKRRGNGGLSQLWVCLL